MPNFLSQRRQGHPTPVLLPGKSHGWRCLGAAVHGVAKSQIRLSNFTFTFHFHALDKEMATHSSVLAWKIQGTGEPGGLPSMGSHGVRHNWSDLAAAAAIFYLFQISLRRCLVWIQYMQILWNNCQIYQISMNKVILVIETWKTTLSIWEENIAELFFTWVKKLLSWHTM